MSLPDTFQHLQQIFPSISKEQILLAIETANDQMPFEPQDLKLDYMVTLLLGNDNFDCEGAVGFDESELCHSSENYRVLREIFPEASPDYIGELCSRRGEDEDLDELIEELSSNGYPINENYSIDVWNKLKQILPNADPQFLREKSFSLKTQNEVECFIDNAICNNDYPTMQEYIKNKQVESDISMLVNNFNVTEYLQNIPNPREYFNDPNRKSPLNADDVNEEDIAYAEMFLMNHYRYLRQKYISTMFEICNRNLTETCNRLDKFCKSFRQPRKLIERNIDVKNVALIQEITYLRHKNYITRFIKSKDEQYRKAREEAAKYGLLETCKCCFDDELIPEECYFCMRGCIFCKYCIKTGTGAAVGNGQVTVSCFNNCGSQFSLRTLQMVLDKNTFDRLALKVQSNDLMEAKVEGLESCPFCDFVTIMEDTDRIFKCQKFDCLKESCRDCRHESHVPLKCDEIEYNEDVRRRTFVENKMSEAVIRKCNACSKIFIKSSGCNKIACSCGSLQCYICGKTIQDYTHFGAGPGKCPLFCSDGQTDLSRVRQGLQNAMAELQHVELKINPAENLDAFFQY